MPDSKVLSLLGLATKAGKTSFGHDAVLGAIGRHKAKGILLASDASARLEREMRREIAFQKSDAYIYKIKESMVEIGAALPRKVGVVSVNDVSFARAVEQQVKEADKNGNC